MNIEELFDPFNYKKYPEFNNYLNKNYPTLTSQNIRKSIETVVLKTLKRIGMIQCHYMVLSDDFAGGEKKQIFSTFFNQDCFQSDRDRYQEISEQWITLTLRH